MWFLAKRTGQYTTRPTTRAAQAYLARVEVNGVHVAFVTLERLGADHSLPTEIPQLPALTHTTLITALASFACVRACVRKAGEGGSGTMAVASPDAEARNRPEGAEDTSHTREV